MYGAFSVLLVQRQCLRCEEPVARGALAFVTSDVGFVPGDGSVVFHPRCAIDVDAVRAFEALRGYRAGVDDDEAIRKLAAQRAKAIDALAKARAAAKKKGKPAVIPAIEPARDPQGRPRVRLYWAGNLASSSGAISELFARLAPNSTLRSPLREFVLRTFVKVTRRSLDDDPSQPLIGALFGTLATVKLVGVQRDKLAAWRAEGVPTPVLWVLDLMRDPSIVDARVLEFRKALDEIGYVGDEAAVVVTHGMDSDAIRAVASALDEAFADGTRKAATTDPGMRAAARLREVLASGDRESLSATLDIALKSLRGTHDKHRAQLSDDAASCLTIPEARGAALRLLQGLPRFEQLAAVRALAAQLLAEGAPKRPLHADFATAWELLAQYDDRQRWALLLAPFTADDLGERRRAAIAERLGDCEDPAVLEQLRAWSDRQKLSGARAEAMTALLRLIARACDASAARRADAKAKRELSAKKTAKKR